MAAPLSKSYASMIRSLQKDVGQEKLDDHCPAVIAAMDKRYTFSSSRQALSALRKAYPECQHFIDEMKKRMSTFNAPPTGPTEKQENRYIAWGKICEFRDMYKEDMTPTERILMALYTYIPPVRLDFTPMKVVKRKPAKLEDGINYYVSGCAKPYFLLHSYKTHKVYGDKEIPIPDILKTELDLFVKEDQVWLLGKDKPWEPETLSNAIKRIFKKYHGMESGVNTLRHSYATMYHAGQKPLIELQAAAGAMLHSPMMSMAYRHISLEDYDSD